jgi:tRNA(Ile)-lysidine synthase
LSDFASDFVEKVFAALAPHGIGSGIVIAVSGGPDSVALTRALATLQGDGRLGRIVLAHFNHQLRGAASDSDELFLRELHSHVSPCARADIVLRCGRADVLRAARAGHDNVEATARRLRYYWLADIAVAEEAAVVVTGHTADDQAETVLHHILRGTGLRGLRGIARCRPLRSPTRLVRPMLDVTRQEVLSYLSSVGQDYCVDGTNHCLNQTRARIRHLLIPPLQSASSGQVVEVLCRIAKEATSHYDRRVGRARKLARMAELPQAGLLHVFNRHLLAEAPRSVLREALRLMWRRANWPERAMTVKHWNRLEDVVVGRRPATVFPGGITASVRGNVTQIGPNAGSKPTLRTERYAWS